MSAVVLGASLFDSLLSEGKLLVWLGLHGPLSEGSGLSLVGSLVGLVAEHILGLIVGSHGLGSLVVEEDGALAVLLVGQLSKPFVVDDAVSVLVNGQVVVVLFVGKGNLEWSDLHSSGGHLSLDVDASEGPELVVLLVTVRPDGSGVLEALSVLRGQALVVVLDPVSLSFDDLVLGTLTDPLSE